jgi:hypothetical protein
MTIKKLTAMPYAQAHIEIDNENNIHLFSYVTLVATITPDGWLTVNGLYSMTTRKHISAFMKEYGGGVLDYQSAKSAYEGGYRINKFTGEIEELGN